MEDVVAARLAELSASWNKAKGEVFRQAISHIRMPLCISDPTQTDNPIVFANDAFCDLTGYSMEEVIGRNCRFLQGPGTTRDSIERLREVLISEELATVEIVNYRKDGSEFINALQLGPISDPDGNLLFYFGSQFDVSSQRRKEKEAAALRSRELLHRLRNIVNVMAVVIKMTSRDYPGSEALRDVITGRLLALGKAHFDTIGEDGSRESLALSQIAETILHAYAPMAGTQVVLNGPVVVLPESRVTPLTLILHELATNAVKYGALSAPQGHVDLSWHLDCGVLNLAWQENGGPAVIVPKREGGSGIIRTIVGAMGGTIVFDWKADGLRVDVQMSVGEHV